MDQEFINEAHRLAVEVQTKAYAPYSKYRVGATVAVGDRLFAGCNVENASYGATICAERNAIFQMVAQLGKQKIDFVVLVTQEADGAPPCGMCLQVISEFASPETPIYIANPEKILRQLTLKDLLPNAFSLT